ncbi:MAG: MBL fold metallo-hydrolase [Lachnospiraceae bacterium]|nr:MBL fold metallo-hydrolase [Lachnospiraceae bacterium]
MSQYKVKLLVLGPVSTDCYILYREGSKRAILIDPADTAGKIVDTLTELELEPEAVLLTHGHFDHIMAVTELKDRYGMKVYAHEEEAEIAENPGLNLSNQFGLSYALKVDETVREGEILEIAGFSLKVLHTPGHTKGSVCYYMEEDKLLFSGDTLFAGSVGRSDFPTGSGAVLIRSIQEKLATLPEDVQVFPGHGEQTNIGYEKTHNPFI